MYESCTERSEREQRDGGFIRRSNKRQGDSELFEEVFERQQGFGSPFVERGDLQIIIIGGNGAGIGEIHQQQFIDCKREEEVDGAPTVCIQQTGQRCLRFIKKGDEQAGGKRCCEQVNDRRIAAESKRQQNNGGGSLFDGERCFFGRDKQGDDDECAPRKHGDDEKCKIHKRQNVRCQRGEEGKKDIGTRGVRQLPIACE